MPGEVRPFSYVCNPTQFEIKQVICVRGKLAIQKSRQGRGGHKNNRKDVFIFVSRCFTLRTCSTLKL